MSTYRMPNLEPYRDRIELLQGTLDMLILQTLLSCSRHGYAIAQAIRAASVEALQVDTGSLYPALHRLERKKWVTSSWSKTENNQRARFYQITREGKKQLVAEKKVWSQTIEAIAAVMSAEFGKA